MIDRSTNVASQSLAVLQQNVAKQPKKGLQKLKRKHKLIIYDYLCGAPQTELAQKYELTQASISRIINDPLSQRVIQRTFADRRGELDALSGMAIHAIRSGLNDELTETRLKAVDRYAKLRESLSVDEQTKTAEDVVGQIINMQINIDR